MNIKLPVRLTRMESHRKLAEALLISQVTSDQDKITICLFPKRLWKASCSHYIFILSYNINSCVL